MEEVTLGEKEGEKARGGTRDSQRSRRKQQSLDLLTRVPALGSTVPKVCPEVPPSGQTIQKMFPEPSQQGPPDAEARVRREGLWASALGVSWSHSWRASGRPGYLHLKGVLMATQRLCPHSHAPLLCQILTAAFVSGAGGAMSITFLP